MLKKPLAIAAIATTVAVLAPQDAAAGDPGVGALLGAAVGAAIGHSVNGHNGAVVGGVLGAMTGASIAASEGYYAPGYAPGYAPPPAPVYYAPGPVVVRPAPVYYAPPPVVVRSRPVYTHYYRESRRPVYAPVVVERGRGERHRHHDYRY